MILHPDGLAAAKACATPGICLFCDDPIAPPKRLLCSSPECTAAYYRAWHRDAKAAHPERYDTEFYRRKTPGRVKRRCARDSRCTREADHLGPHLDGNGRNFGPMFSGREE